MDINIATLTSAASTLMGGVLPLIGVALGSYLSRRNTIQTAHALADLDRRKYTQNKIWDFRREIYSEIMSDLIICQGICTNIYDNFCDDRNNSEAYYRSQSYEYYMRAINNIFENIAQVFLKNLLILSDDFNHSMLEWKDAFCFEDPNSIPPQHAKYRKTLMDKWVPVLRDIIQKDLSPTDSA